MSTTHGPTPERVEFLGTEERITPDQWQRQTEAVRSMLLGDGMAEADAADDLRVAFGEITFIDDLDTSWRHDGSAWWRWSSSSWEQARPPAELRVHRAVFELERERADDPDREQLLIEAEGMAAEYERFIAEHPDRAWSDMLDDEDDPDFTMDAPPIAPPIAPIDTPRVVAPVSGFLATHVVPATGMRTWAEPGDVQPGPSLDPGLDVQVVQAWGDWAHVTFDNGWTAWVDARQLVPYNGAGGHVRSTPPSSPRAAPSAAPTPLSGQRFVTPSKATWPVSAGAAAMALGSFLPWFDLGAGIPTQSAFDAALNYLLDYENPGTGLRIGLVLLFVAGGAFLARHMRGWEKAVRPLAAVGAAISALFAVQTQRLLGAAEEAGGTAPGLFDVVGVGVWISLAGSVLLAWGASKR